MVSTTCFCRKLAKEKSSHIFHLFLQLSAFVAKVRLFLMSFECVTFAVDAQATFFPVGFERRAFGENQIAESAKTGFRSTARVKERTKNILQYFFIRMT